MATRKRSSGRTTPKGTRPAHLRPVGGAGPDASPLDGIIAGGASDVLAADDPVAAEAWASQLLGLFGTTRIEAQLAGQDVPPLEEAILERCEQLRNRSALVVAASLAAVLPAPLDDRAAQVVTSLRRSVAAPAWLSDIGQVAPTRAWVASDAFGDQDSIIVGFAHPSRDSEHAVLVLVDHNLAGQAKDAWMAEDPDVAVAAWSSTGDEHMLINEVTIDTALARLREAMAASDLWNGEVALRTEEFAEHRALVWSRLRRAGHGDGTYVGLEVSQTEREQLVSDFVVSEPGQAVRHELEGIDVELLARCLVDLRSDYEGRPLRWSPMVVRHVLTSLAPRKLLLDPDQARTLPAVLRGFVRYATSRSGLAPTFSAEILTAVDQFEPEFLTRIGDPAASGPAKAVLAALQARGVSLDDSAAVTAALSDLGSIHVPEQPLARRRSAAGAPPEVVDAATHAPVLARLASLAEFYGDGRKLTQTGQPTLADARALVGILGTEDRIDETIGDRTFKTQSAAELRELAFTIRWAVVAGVLRKENGKLRATAAWRKLEAKPLDRWLKAVDALPTLGPIASFHAHNRYRGPDEVVDELMGDVLHLLRGSPMPFDAVLDEVCDLAETMYEWRSPYMQDADHRRTSFGYDLDLLTRILGWAAIVERFGAKLERDKWDASDQVVGGTLRLTVVGRWWLEA